MSAPTWKIEPGCLPLWIWAEKTGIDAGAWFLVPSWRLDVQHEAVAGVDLRAHKHLTHMDTWVIAEATTGFSAGVRAADTRYEAGELFVLDVLPTLTQERFAKAIGAARMILRDKPPRPELATAEAS